MKAEVKSVSPAVLHHSQAAKVVPSMSWPFLSSASGSLLIATNQECRLVFII